MIATSLNVGVLGSTVTLIASSTKGETAQVSLTPNTAYVLARQLIAAADKAKREAS